MNIDQNGMPPNPSRLKRALWILALIPTIVFICMLYTILSDQPVSVETSLPEFDSLFTAQAHQKLHVRRTVTTRNREPVSTYIYDSLFNISVVKVRLQTLAGLDQLLICKNEKSSQEGNGIYSGLPSNNTMKINLKAGTQVVASAVYFNIDGIDLNINKADNLYCYSFKFNTFSIRYNKETYDIIAKGDITSSQIQIAFLKKGKQLYIILLNADNAVAKADPRLLYSIINK